MHEIDSAGSSVSRAKGRRARTQCIAACLLILPGLLSAQFQQWVNQSPTCYTVSSSFGAAPNEARGLTRSGGDLFVTSDFGKTWQKVTVDLGGNSPVTPYAAAMDPLDADVLAVYDDDLERLLVSSDGGASWSLGATADGSRSPRLAFSPTRANQLFLGGGPLLYRSNDAGETVTDISPVPQSTANATFVSHEPIPWNHPSAPLRTISRKFVFGGVTYPPRLFESDDEGDTWAEIPIPAGILFADAFTSPSDPSQIYLHETKQGAHRLFWTDDDGTTWTEIPLPSGNGNGEVDFILVVAGSSGDELFVTDDPFYLDLPNRGDVVFTRTSGGAWQTVDDLARRQVVGMTTLGNRWLADTDQGHYESLDEGLSWKPVGGGVATGVSALLALSNEPAPKVLTSNNCWANELILSRDGGRTFGVPQFDLLNNLNDYTSWLIEFHPADPDFAFFMDSNALWVTTDGGASWDSEDWGRVVAFDPADPLVVFATQADLLNNQSDVVRSDDRGSTWTTLSTVPQVDALVVDPSDSTVLYALTRSDLRVSTDGGATWTPVGPFDFNLRLAAVERGQATALFAMDLFSTSRVSLDQGATWTDLQGLPGSFPSLPVVDPRTGDFLVADDGDLYSSANGVHWTPTGELAGVRVTDLRTNQFGHLVAGTSSSVNRPGEGVWVYNDTGFRGDFETGDFRYWTTAKP